MSIELSDRGCPECGHRLQTVYASELKQVVSRWVCTSCSFSASGDDEFDRVPVTDSEEYILRIERSLTPDDVRDGRGSIGEEFRALAQQASDGEVWMLVDPDDDTLVDIVASENDETAENSQ